MTRAAQDAPPATRLRDVSGGGGLATLAVRSWAKAEEFRRYVVAVMLETCAANAQGMDAEGQP